MAKPNIILIVADTMRKDALSLYNKNVKTPNIELLAKDSTVFNNTISPSPWTIPSHASIFTGKYPSEHGLHETTQFKSTDLTNRMRDLKYKTIAEILRNAGYNTIGISENPFISPNTGFDRGFNFFYSLALAPGEFVNNLLGKTNWSTNINPNSSKFNVLLDLIKHHEVKALLPLAREYLKVKTSAKAQLGLFSNGINIRRINDILNSSTLLEPFFLFFNLMDMHEPYIKNFDDVLFQFSTLSGKSDISNISRIKSIKNEYYKRANNIDNFIGNLVDYLKTSKIYNKTLIIFTSDHGQALMEKNFYGHGIYLYNELINVPLIIKYPNNRHIENNNYISTVSIFDIIKDAMDNIYNIEYTDSIFSESYGIQNNIPRKFLNNKKLKDIDIKRKAIFFYHYKLVVDCKENIEEFLKDNYNINPVQYKDIVKEMLDRVKIFNGNELL